MGTPAIDENSIDFINIDDLIEDGTIHIDDPMEFGFYVAKGWEDKEINMPRRQTFWSAGYDIEAAEDVVVPPMLAMMQEIVEVDPMELVIADDSTPVTVQQIFLQDNTPTLVSTGLKCKLPDGMVLKLFPRSSLAYKKNITVANNVGIIDADYFENESNDGHIMVAVLNRGTKPFEIKKGDRIAQGLIESFLVFPNEATPMDGRTGGFGSTDKEAE